MRVRSPALVLLVAVCACTQSRPFPLGTLEGISRIAVQNPVGADTAHVISSPEQIARAVAAVRSVPTGWKHPVTTVPVGHVAAEFYRDTVLVGVVWLGLDYIIARASERPLIRSASPDELARLAEAFEVPRKVIVVPPRAERGDST